MNYILFDYFLIQFQKIIKSLFILLFSEESYSCNFIFLYLKLNRATLLNLDFLLVVIGLKIIIDPNFESLFGFTSKILVEKMR